MKKDKKSIKPDKKLRILIGGVAAALLLLMLLIFPKGRKGVIEDDITTPAPTGYQSAGVTADDPHTGETGSEPVPSGGQGGVIVLAPIDGPNPTPGNTSPSETAAPGATPVSGHAPGDDDPGTGSGTGQGSTGDYHCGAPHHHCDSPETHAYILNLEREGCPYCGRHDCPSFYAVDEWGTAVYDPTECPNYDIRLDPVYYCQHCHKPCGDGTNGTCVRFVNACHCPVCGKWVEAWVCHSCEQ